MEELYYINAISNVSAFSIKNGHIATFVYNVNNGIYLSLCNNLNLLVSGSATIYNDDNWLTNLIFYLFLGLILGLIVLQLPFCYWITNAINKDAELFLMLSRREYIKMGRSSNTFLILVKVNSLVLN